MCKYLFVVAIAVLLATLQPAGAADTPQFGYLLPSVRNAGGTELPRRDKYATIIAQAMASAASFSIEAIPAHTASGLDLQALCSAMHLVGVINPFVGWTTDTDTTSARARAEVYDCHGIAVYSGEASDVGPLAAASTTESQVDAHMNAAARKLGARFAQFITDNQGPWSASQPAPAPSPAFAGMLPIAAVAALTRCSQDVTEKRYVQAIAACNDANVTVTVVPAAEKALRESPQNDSSRSQAILIGLSVIGAYCQQAEAHYYLGEPGAGVAEATACATWADRLLAFLRAQHADSANATFRQWIDIIQAQKTVLAFQYPAVEHP